MTTLLLEKASYVEGRERAEVGWTSPSDVVSLPVTSGPMARKRRAKALIARRALDISLSQTQDGHWVADEKGTLQFGVGAAPEDAIADLMGTLADYREVLRTRRYRLAPYLREHLAWLESALD